MGRGREGRGDAVGELEVRRKNGRFVVLRIFAFSMDAGDFIPNRALLQTEFYIRSVRTWSANH